ncbi:DNA ligase [Rhodococcus opacus]|nr:DNA ligase [Rhodococcus opacus]
MLSPTTQLRNEAPVTCYVFDVLALDGKSTTGLPYLRRRTELDDLALSGPRLQVPPYRTDVDGEQMLDLARRHHLEGAVAQRVHSTYQPGRRSPAWIKQPLRANTEGIIVGWVDGTGAARDGIGSLLLAAYDDNHRLVYIGHVGTGFTTATRKSLRGQLAAIERPTTPLDSPPPARDTRRVRAGSNHGWSAMSSTANTPAGGCVTRAGKASVTTRRPAKSTCRGGIEACGNGRSDIPLGLLVVEVPADALFAAA